MLGEMRENLSIERLDREIISTDRVERANLRRERNSDVRELRERIFRLRSRLPRRGGSESLLHSSNFV